MALPAGLQLKYFYNTARLRPDTGGSEEAVYLSFLCKIIDKDDRNLENGHPSV